MLFAFSVIVVVVLRIFVFCFPFSSLSADDLWLRGRAREGDETISRSLRVHESIPGLLTSSFISHQQRETKVFFFVVLFDGPVLMAPGSSRFQ